MLAEKDSKKQALVRHLHLPIAIGTGKILPKFSE